MATTTAPPIDPDALAAETSGRSRTSKAAMLAIQPAIIVVVLIGFVIWHSVAKFDSIEARQLEWGNIGTLLWQHIKLSVLATIIVLIIAIPLGVLLTRKRFRKFAPVVVGIANIGQAAPAVGLIVLVALWLGLGFWPVLGALSLYGLLPSLRNAIVGLQQVDQRLVEAGRGMGMSAAAVLFRIEMPLAVPVIVAGARLALVLVIGTATLAAFVNGGGLGALVTIGISLSRTPVLVSGALLVAALALFIDWLGRVVEEIAKPKGI